MKRKIVKQGNQALTITLPSSWAKRYGVKPKGEIEVEEFGSKLIINSSCQTQVMNAVLDVINVPKELIQRYLVGAYKKGSDEIEVHFSAECIVLDTSEVMQSIDIIQRVVNDFLIGMEIVEHKDNYCKIKQISSISANEFDLVLRRNFYLLISLSEMAYEAVKKNRIEYRLIKNIHNNIEKFVNYAIRILNKRGYDEKTATFYYLLTEIEEISDAYTYAMRELSRDKIRVDSRVLDVFQKVNESLRTFYEFFYNAKKEKAVSIIRSRRQVASRIAELMKTPGIANAVLLSQLFQIDGRLLNLVETRMSMME